MTTIYIEEIDSDDEGPSTPPPDGREFGDDEHEEGIVLEAGQDDPDGVCSVLDPGCMTEAKDPEAVGDGYVMAWRHMQLSDKCRPHPRGGHATAALTETTLVLFGGADRTPQPFNDTFIMDVHADAWTAVDAADPPQPRSGHSLAVVDGKLLYVFGGQDYSSGSLLSQLHVLDLSAQAPSWTEIDCRDVGPCARSSHCSEAINECLYVFGGCDAQGQLMNDMHVFNTSSNTWTLVQDQNSPTPREMASSVVVGALIYMFGGRAESGPLGCSAVFDTNLNQWLDHQIAPVEPRMAHAAAVVSTSMFVFGGATQQGICDQLLCLDTLKQEWNVVNCKHGSLPSARFAHTLTSVINGLVVIGGIDPEKDYNDAHMLEVTCL